MRLLARRPRCGAADAHAHAAQEMQSIDNPYTGDRLTIDPRNLAQRILEASCLLSKGGSAC
jgi:hypothetical protein